MSDIAYASNIIIFIAVLLISLSIHEATHAFIAHQLGDSTAADGGRISLNPLKHVDLYTTILLPVITLLLFQAPILAAKPVMVDLGRLRFGDFGWALVSIAGPLSNLMLAILSIILYKNGFVAVGFESFAQTFITLNVAMFSFNMLPIPPLDGSRLLYAFAPTPLQELMERFEALGFGVCLLIIFMLSFILSPLLSTINSAIIGFLV